MKNHRHELKENGVTLLPKIFSTSKVDMARHALWEVIQGGYETGLEPESRFWNVGDDIQKIIKIDKPHLCNSVLLRLITDKSFGEHLSKVTNSKKIQVWHSQAVWKPSGGGKKGHAGWHRDAQYWPFWGTEGLFTAWIALSDVKIDSGPVQFIIKSNSWDTVAGLDFFDNDITKQEKIIKKSHKNINILYSNIKKGEISIHDSLTYHSSGPNQSKKPRVGLVVHFCTDKSKRVKNSDEYLDQLGDYSKCPIIYNA